tara:strand:- start:12121 stop:12465 length:345 start_codon:yes stop_codon:yes gene_type:complete
MGTKYSSGKHSIAQCDRCGFRFKLNRLRALTIKTKNTSIRVCPECWEEDHPQLQLGMYPVNDPQSVMNARPETYDGGSRTIQWGFNPVGLNNPLRLPMDNSLVATIMVGMVIIS